MSKSKVEVVSVEDCGWYMDNYTSGSTVTVTLYKDGVYAKCEDILIWDAEFAEDAFDEWMELAADGEEGYSTWVD